MSERPAPTLLEALRALVSHLELRDESGDHDQAPYLDALRDARAAIAEAEALGPQDDIALRESEARYRVLVETTREAVILVDERGTILFVNAVVERLFGYSPDELVGQPLSTLITEELRAAHEAGFARYQATGRRRIPWDGVELPGLHRSGRQVPLEIAFGEFTHDGHRRFIGYARDITDRKRSESEREALERQREEWTSVIAHDLRQPVTVITGYADRLARRLGPDASAEDRASLDHIRAAARNLGHMIGDLLDVSLMDAGRLQLNRQAVELPVLISAVIERLRTVTAGQPVELQARPSVPLVWVDEGRIEQVFGNLLSNAAKYSTPGTPIKVTIEERPGEVEVSVINQGAGIPADEQAFLFTRFHRTRSARSAPASGLGLGLYLSRLLVELHGGRIWVESIPHGQTRFAFTLPPLRVI
jgi:PAS domain S-box-containing protein